MLSTKRALICLPLLLVLMSGCASSPAPSPSVHVGQTQTQVPPPPPSLVLIAKEAPDYLMLMERALSSSMQRLGLISPGSEPQPTSPQRP